MAAARPGGTSGIAGSRGSFRFTWRGAQVKHALDDAMQEAMQETAEAAKAAAQELAPVRTGLLKSSVYAQVDATGADSRRTLAVGADAPYAVFVELGTATAPAQPFLRPAVDQEAPKLTQRLRAAASRIR